MFGDVAIIVDGVNDRGADLHVAIAKVGKAELPEQVVVEGLAL